MLTKAVTAYFPREIMGYASNADGDAVPGHCGRVSRCWLMAYRERVWLRDDYKNGYQAGAEYDRATKLQGCAGEVDARFGVGVSGSMPEDAAAFTVGCYDASRERYRPEDVGSMLFEFFGG